jgi:hypothetical protein
LSPTPPNGARAAKPVALGKIGGTAAPVELKIKRTGEPAAVFADYQRAYQAAHGETPDRDALAAHMLAAFIESDRGFAAWRRSHPEG